MGNSIRVLIVEDSAMDADLLLFELRRGGYEPVFLRVETAQEMELALESECWDIVIADYILPTFSAPAALEIMQSHNLDLPFIILSGKIGEETAVAALKAGAHDFIIKGNTARLIPAIERELREAAVRRERKKAEETISKLFRAVEQSADAVVITNHEGIIEYVNSGFEKLTGYTRNEAIGNTPRMLKSDRHDAAFYAEMWRSLLAGQVFRAEYINRKKNGDLYYQEETITPVFNSSNEVSHFVSTGRDVTERKKAQEQLEQQVKRLAALRSIDKSITGSFDLRFTLKVILAQVTAQLRADAASVLLIDPHSNTLKYAAGRGFKVKGLFVRQPTLGEGCAGLAIAERRMISIPNLHETSHDCQRGRFMTVEGFQAYFAIPLIAKGEVKGVLEIFNRAPLYPDPEWSEFMAALAEQTAIAVDNATLFTRLQQSNKELVQAYETTLEGWSRALDLRDKETEGHTLRVTEMTVQLAKAMGLSEQEIVHVRRGALLHDIGKMGIPDHILLKPGPLTDEEWQIMRKHPTFARELLQPIAFLRPAIDIPYCHHEKWDGTGYPQRLKGEEIPLGARIFSVIDVWDALRSDRPYRKGWEEDKIVTYLQDESGTSFDPQVVEVFLNLLAQFSPQNAPNPVAKAQR